MKLISDRSEKLWRPGLVLAAVVWMGACSPNLPGVPSSLNPFAEKDSALPGERIPVLPKATQEIDGGTASVAAPVASNDWSQPGGNAANAPGNVALASGGNSSAFRARVGKSTGKKGVRASAPPIVHGGQIYVYDATGTVTALSSGGGKSWSVSLKPEKEKSVATGGGIAAAGNILVAATGFGEVAGLNVGSGQRVWTYDLDAPAKSAPTAANGKVYVVTVTNVLHAINLVDGTEIWTFPGIPEAEGVVSSASPAVVGSTVVVPYSSGEVIAFDAESGELKWADAVVRASRTRAIAGLTDVSASPVVVDGTVYASGVSGRTIAVKLANGERVWELNIGAEATPAISGNAMFIIDLDDNIVAIEKDTGNIIWRTALPVIRKSKRSWTGRTTYSTWTGPTLAGGTLWAVSSNKMIIGVDPATGQIVSDRKLQSAAYMKPIAAGGKLYVLAGDGSLQAFQ